MVSRIVDQGFIGWQRIAVVVSSLWRLIQDRLKEPLAAFAGDSPPQNAAGRSIHEGYEVDPVFLSPMNVYNSSISIVSTSSGTGAGGKRAAYALTQLAML